MATRLNPPLVVLTGAGISTDSGIPDFRSPGGVWERFDPQLFTIDRFHKDPAAFWDRRARLIAAMDYLDARPNAAHTLLAEAAKDGRVACIITQNVDGLHAKAGTPPDRLIEVHGNGSQTVCLDCAQKEPVQDVLARRKEGQAPRCLACRGLLKPDVVLFGEPVTALDRAAEAVAAAGSLLVVGTSLTVHPAAGLVGHASRLGIPLLILNRDPTPYDALALLRDPRPLLESLPEALRSVKPPLQ